MATTAEERFRDRMAEIEALAAAQGLDFFPINFETVPEDMMTEVASYGLPTRARHWSYGKVYGHQRLYGKMGLSKIYEIIINNDPSMAFLLDTNPEIANLLVTAHVYGHSDFFKNNLLFEPTDRNMINNATSHAIRIDGYIERYGLETVEHLMDIGFALDRHIDPHLGTQRAPYPERRIVEKEYTPRAYEDLFDKPKPSVQYVVEGEKIPPHPEYDLLWFLITYGKLEPWQKDVLSIQREESYYFFPQFMTKIMNEGWASYWHAELFHLWEHVSPEEQIEFARLHAGVVNPGARFSLNPYYLGFKIFHDIEKRWDEKRKLWLERDKKGEKQDGPMPITGREKIFEVRKTDDDISFINNYLTFDLVRDLELFSFAPKQQGKSKPVPDNTPIVITSRELEAVKQALVTPRYNYGVPRIAIRDMLQSGLYLEHIDRDTTFLDRAYATNTLNYIAELWKNPVSILTKDEQGNDCSLTAKPSS